VTSTAPDRIDPATVRSFLDRPDAVTILDVRTPAEFDTAHIRGSYNVPLNLLGEHAEQIAARLDRQVVFVCGSGARAEQARERVAGIGADRIHVRVHVLGGMTAYIAAAGDDTLVRGRPRWRLERQVRLVAGALMLAGLAIGLRLPAGRWLSAGVGAGLTVSALTDTRAMGRLLAALPYNRGPRDRTPAQVLAALPTARAA
jgi:rhodanese-related sulfurtransferase